MSGPRVDTDSFEGQKKSLSMPLTEPHFCGYLAYGLISTPELF